MVGGAAGGTADGTTERIEDRDRSALCDTGAVFLRQTRRSCNATLRKNAANARYCRAALGATIVVFAPSAARQ